MTCKNHPAVEHRIDDRITVTQAGGHLGAHPVDRSQDFSLVVQAIGIFQNRLDLWQFHHIHPYKSHY